MPAFSQKISRKIDELLGIFEYKSEFLSFMVESLCDSFPGVKRSDFVEELEFRIRLGPTHRIIPPDIMEIVMTHSEFDLDRMMENFSDMYPNLAREDIKREIKFSIDKAKAKVEKRHSKAPSTVSSLKRIASIDMNDALQLDEIDDMVTYLNVVYPHLTNEEIKEEIKAVKKGEKKKETKKLARKEIRKITENDVYEALEFYSYQFGPGLKEKVIAYMSNKYPELIRAQIVTALSEYEFGNQTPQKPQVSGSGTASPKPWSASRTPAARGRSYQPIDFSPSSYGACGSKTMDFLKSKRDKYFPRYVSPPRASKKSDRIYVSRKRSHSPTTRTRNLRKKLSFDSPKSSHE